MKERLLNLRHVTIMSQEQLHYEETGLPNIYLANGFRWVDTKHGRALAIANVEGLHKAIGMDIVRSMKNLTPEAFRFLRNSMLMSQSTLGGMLGVTKLTVLRWENGQTEIPRPADLALRQMFSEYAIGTSSFRDLLKEIGSLEDEHDRADRVFEDRDGEWEVAA